MQSRKHSLIMAGSMALIGYIFSVFGQMFLFWALDMPFKLYQCLIIGGFFSGVSILKNFGIIRLFLNKEKQ